MMNSVEGNVDHLGPAPLQGWARSPAEPARRLDVRIVLGDRSVGVVTADRHRPDLEAAGIGDGRHGFAFDLSPHLDPGVAQTLRVACADTGDDVWTGSTEELRRRVAALDALRTCPLWAIRSVVRESACWRLSGYLVPAAGERADPMWTADGEPVDDVDYPVESPPAPARLWFVPDHLQLGFSLRVPIEASSGSGSGDGPVVDCLDRRTGRPLVEHGAFYVPADFEEQMQNVPGPVRMLRVQGHERADTHLLWGHTACRKLDRLLQARFDRRLDSFESILDWGCGCGRLSRHLARLPVPEPGPRLTGVDIDSDNVAWCRDHLAVSLDPAPEFQTVPLLPPTDLPTDAFDLIVGHSVMTHLREDDQLAWLSELQRVMRPGGFALLTINAETSIWWTDPPANVVREWREAGFTDAARDAALDGFVDDEQYYRATFHRHDYVREVWGRFFEVVEILPAFAHIQDLVVLRSSHR